MGQRQPNTWANALCLLGRLSFAFLILCQQWRIQNVQEQWRIQNVQDEGAKATFWLKKGVLASLYLKKCMKIQYFQQ